MRGEGRPSLRSVDSEVKRRAIEPRNHSSWRAFVVDISGGRVESVDPWSQSADSISPGSENMANDQWVSRELGRPWCLHRTFRMGDRNRQLPGPRRRVCGRGERTSDAAMVSRRELSERREMGIRESERLVVPTKRGNRPLGPRRGKGAPCHDTVGGKHGGCIGTRVRVHETTTDRGSEFVT